MFSMARKEGYVRSGVMTHEKGDGDGSFGFNISWPLEPWNVTSNSVNPLNYSSFSLTPLHKSNKLDAPQGSEYSCPFCAKTS